MRYGAAVFPMTRAAAVAAPVSRSSRPPGDPASYAAEGKNGPVLLELLAILGDIAPDGGTPTAATLRRRSPTLKALPGKTFVILATDGAPNCNPGATCAPTSACSTSGAVRGRRQCETPSNCCDPGVVQNGPTLRRRRRNERRITQLGAGIVTYVVGMPGSELYSSVLDDLAIAGGTARPTAPYYFAVSDADPLTLATSRKSASRSRSPATSSSTARRSTRRLVNVYLDQHLVQLDPVDGWSWTSDNPRDSMARPVTH